MAIIKEKKKHLDSLLLSYIIQTSLQYKPNRGPMKDKIEQVIRKMYSYWWVDGMAEIGLGLFFAVLAGYNYLIEQIPEGKSIGMVLAIAEPLLFLVCWFGYGRLVRWVKEHFTYRRTGYVAYQTKNRKSRVVRAIIGGVLGFAMSMVITYIGPQVLKVNSLIMVGSLLALVTLFLAVWYRINRLFILAVMEFGLGLVASSLPLGSDLQSILLMACIGAGWFVSGLAAFMVYLLKTKPEGA